MTLHVGKKTTSTRWWRLLVRAGDLTIPNRISNDSLFGIRILLPVSRVYVELRPENPEEAVRRPSASYMEEARPRLRHGAAAVAASSYVLFWSAFAVRSLLRPQEEESRTGSKMGVSVANSLKRPLRQLRQRRGLVGPTRR